jgi:hypothetical protein
VRTSTIPTKRGTLAACVSCAHWRVLREEQVESKYYLVYTVERERKFAPAGDASQAGESSLIYTYSHSLDKISKIAQVTLTL